MPDFFTLTQVDPTSIPGRDGPEFLDATGVYELFGIRKSLLWRLLAERRIRAVSIRKKGNTRGKRLFDAASIRAFLDANVDVEPNDAEKTTT